MQINFNCYKLYKNKLLSYFFWKYNENNINIIKSDEEVITYFIKLNDGDKVDYHNYTYENGFYSSQKVALPKHYWYLKIANTTLDSREKLETKSFFIYNDTTKTKTKNPKYQYDGEIYNFSTQNNELLKKIKRFLVITYSFFYYDRRREMKNGYIIFSKSEDDKWYPNI